MTKTRAFAILRASCRVSASGSGPSWQSGRLLFNQNLGSCWARSRRMGMQCCRQVEPEGGSRHAWLQC